MSPQRQTYRLSPWFCGLVALAALAATPSPAQPPAPILQGLFPAGGQRGRTFEVTLTGVNLQGATGVRVSGSGVSAAVVQAAKPDSAKISVSVALNAELGERDLRLLTLGGVSSRCRFMVGDVPEINEVEPNSEKNQAQALASLPVLVNGQILEPDRDYFRFTAKAGQTFVFALEGRTLLPFIPDAVPGWLDGCLTLCDAQGKELATVDDFNLQPDPVLIYTIPKDGEYLLELKDILYRGRATFTYRLAIGVLPYVTSVFPLGGPRGGAVQLELRGVNLPLASLNVPIPGDSPAVRLFGLNGPEAWNSLPLAVGDISEAREAEPNDSLPQANRVAVPVTVNGCIQRSGDSDWFVFSAQAGQTLALDVSARRLGSPLDSMLYLFNAQGGELARNDDTVDNSEALLNHHADSRLVYTFPAAADYLVRIKDIQQNGGEEYSYRLSIGPPRADFALRVTPDNPRLTKGDTAVVTVRALRKDFGGEIALAVENLPAGFVAADALIGAGQEQTRLTITASADAAIGVVTPNIVGKASIAGAPVARTALGTEEVMEAFTNKHSVPTRDLALAVIDPVLLTLSTNVSPAKPLEVRRGTDVAVVVKATRHGGAKGPVSLALDGAPAWLSVKPVPPAIPAEKDELAITLSIAKDAPAGARENVFLSGTLNTGPQSATRFAPAIPLKVLAQ